MITTINEFKFYINESLNFTFESKPIVRLYYFNTDNYDYVVQIYTNNSLQFPWFGFKAKKSDDIDFYYDADIITNDNIYLIMNTISDILKTDHTKFNTDGYLFSTRSTKKGNQRMNFYTKLIKKNNYSFEILPENQGIKLIL